MAKWDLSKLPEGRRPLPDEWFRERAQMQERIEELEAKLAKAMLALDEAIYLLDPDDEDIAKETGLHRIVTICAELKWEKPTS
jgi:hypothetical protein